MPYEDKTQMGSGPIRRASTDTVKGEVAPGYAVKQGELVAFASAAFAYNLLTDSSTGGTTVTFTNATDVVNWNANGLAANTAIEFSGGTAPAGLTFPGIYYVKVAETNGFTLSATPGGAQINITDNGSGTITAKVVPTAALNYSGLIFPASVVDTAVSSAAKTEFRTNLLGAAAIAKSKDDPDRTLTVFTHPIVELLTDDTVGLYVGAPVKLKDSSTKYESPYKWTLATYGTDELGVVIEQAPIRYPDYGYKASVAAGTTYSLNALAAPVKVAAVLRTRFN